MGSHQPIRKTVVPAPVAIPDKLYFRIGDVAKLCAVAPYVLRFWETEFTQLKPNKGGTGQRLYRKKDVEIALRIKTLLYEQGFTIPGARQVLKGDAQPVSDTPPTDFAARPVLQRSAEAEPSDRGTELRLRAQLADLREEMQTLLGLLSSAPSSTAQPTIAAPKTSRPRLVLEPRPPRQETKPAAPITTLHLAQGDLFSAE